MMLARRKCLCTTHWQDATRALIRSKILGCYHRSARFERRMRAKRQRQSQLDCCNGCWPLRKYASRDSWRALAGMLGGNTHRNNSSTTPTATLNVVTESWCSQREQRSRIALKEAAI